MEEICFYFCFVSSYEKMLNFFSSTFPENIGTIICRYFFLYSFKKKVVSSEWIWNAKPLVPSWDKTNLVMQRHLFGCCTPFVRTLGSFLCSLCKWVALAERPAHVCALVTYGFPQLLGSTQWAGCDQVPLLCYMICEGGVTPSLNMMSWPGK